MCLRCDGYSWEEIERAEELTIAVHGWLLASVELTPAGTGWSYTIGLSENFGQPDLVMVDEDYLWEGMSAVRAVATAVAEDGSSVLASAARRGLSLTPFDGRTQSPEPILGWIDRYDRLPEPGEMLQLHLPSRG